MIARSVGNAVPVARNRAFPIARSRVRTSAYGAHPDAEGPKINLINLVKTADDLLPHSGTSVPLLLWQAVQRDDPRLLLSELNDADIERLWRLAAWDRRHIRAQEYRIWDDLPTPTAGRPVRFRARTTMGARFLHYVISPEHGDDHVNDKPVNRRNRGNKGDMLDVRDQSFVGWVEHPLRHVLALLARPFPFDIDHGKRFKALVGTALVGAGTCDMVFEHGSAAGNEYVRVVGPKVFVSMVPSTGRYTLLVREA